MKITKVALAMLAAGLMTQATAETVIWEGQSPVDIVGAKSVNNTAIIRYSYSKENIVLVNTYSPSSSTPKEFGTLKAKPTAGALAFNSFVTVNGEKYVLAQFHFHTPSEHTVATQPSPMEVHLVHLKLHDNGVPYCIGEPGSLLVIGSLINEGAASPELERIFNSKVTLPLEAGPSVTVANFDFRKLLPANGATYRYHGSLTAPSGVDCSSGANATNTLNGDRDIAIYDSTVAHQLADTSRAEDGTFPEAVSWVVNVNPISMSREQIQRFKELFEEGNSRPVQDLNGRQILRMN